MTRERQRELLTFEVYEGHWLTGSDDVTDLQ